MVGGGQMGWLALVRLLRARLGWGFGGALDTQGVAGHNARVREERAMTSRERVNAAVRRRPVDRVPKEMSFTPAVWEVVRARLGPDVSPHEYFGWDTREIGFRGPAAPGEFAAYYPWRTDVQINPDYGTGEVPGTFHHFAAKVFPLARATTLAELEAYPWPDFTPPERWQHLAAQTAELQAQGYHVSAFAGHIWETGWQILGYERTLADLVLNPEIPAFVLNRICEDNCFKAARMAEAGIDMLRLGDDVGMQDRLVMRPETWRAALKPLLARVIAAARAVNPELPVWYHSDGDIRPIIEDLIEVGVTVLNPVQPESMDLAEIAARYGDRLCFWGCIGTQQVMPWGSPAEVREAVRRAIELMAPGLVLAPTHVLEPEVPWENIVAFHEAIDEFGVFER